MLKVSSLSFVSRTFPVDLHLSVSLVVNLEVMNSFTAFLLGSVLSSRVSIYMCVMDNKRDLLCCFVCSTGL